MELKIIEITPTELEFGGVVGKSTDPKAGLREAGPFDMRFGAAQLKEVRVGLVGTPDMNSKAIHWINRCQNFIPTAMKNFKQYPDFDGFEAIFRAKLLLNPIWEYTVNQEELNNALAIEDSFDRFEKVLFLFSTGIEKLADSETTKPNVVICALPESILEACRNVERKLSRPQKKIATKAVANSKVGIQLSLFDQPTIDNAEDLLYRDFRRALKAKAILAKMPIQIGRDNLFLDSPDNQDAATRAWNSCVTLYYKAGGIPWRLKNNGLETCFVGVTFHHLRTTNKAVVKSCLAQGFSSEGEGFALRGGDVEQNAEPNGRNKVPHLSEKQAYDLGIKIIKEYAYRTGMNPQRIVMHKTSIFNEAEENGFRAAFSSIPIVELINLLPTSFMLLKHSSYPVNRGTLCIVKDSYYYLFNTGYIKEIGTYPGPHIPRPIEIRSNEPLDIERAAEDILALARMNWNTSSITGGDPVTLFFSRQLGGIMSELKTKQMENLPTSFRYYI
ncbi:MAG: hypothetical protein R2822_08665 [Spirosomataceae bacterium]